MTEVGQVGHQACQAPPDGGPRPQAGPATPDRGEEPLLIYNVKDAGGDAHPASGRCAHHSRPAPGSVWIGS
ncbi:hypothetical protein GCM10009678_00100 [Actinomadura kijaniata]